METHLPIKPSNQKFFGSFFQKRTPSFFLLSVVLFYATLILPILLLHHFDVSAFILAGDRFVDAHQLASPILVHRQSTGYDGQFYYRMALGPLSFSQSLGGVVFDHPAWRMQRIVYPVCAWLLSFGRPALVPSALLLINLAGLGAIAAISIRLARAAHLARWVPLAIVLWPGFLVALTHDTTEILSEALVLAALLCRVRKRIVLYALYGALAVLTREMTLLIFAGFLLRDAVDSVKARRLSLALVCGVLIGLPAAIWHVVLTWSWPVMPQNDMNAHNLGAPLFGITDMLIACLAGSRLWASSPAKDLVVRAMVLLTAPALLAFCGLVATRLGPVLRGRALLGPLGLSWCLLAVLMSLMTDTGPWIDPAAYFRAFTECFVAGCLVLGSASPPPAPRWAFAGGAVFITIWIYCLVQLRLS